MKPTYEETIKFMKDYFTAYNAYAQNSETVHRMDDYYMPDVRFVPFIAAFGGPENALTSRDDFYRTFIDHPSRYETLEGEDITVDERRMVTTALIKATLFESGTDRVLLSKHYLVRYDLTLDDEDRLKIKTILFFWEVAPPELDAEYGVEGLDVLRKGKTKG
jgi:hypothetical protein